MADRSVLARRRGDQGFTLVELLVVIAILGILAAIVVFAVGGISDKGQSSANKTDCSVISAAEEAYFAQKSVYTDKQSDLVNAGFLHAPSTTAHLITLVPAAGATPATYTIAGCA